MGSSYLVGIQNNYTAKILASYENSWLFSPVVWDVLTEKYIPDIVLTPNGKKGIIGPYNEEVWTATNDKVNTNRNLADRICWDLIMHPLYEKKEFVTEFVVIENGSIRFIRNVDYEYGNKAV